MQNDNKKPIGIQPRAISMKEITRVADEMKLLRESIEKLTAMLQSQQGTPHVEWEEAESAQKVPERRMILISDLANPNRDLHISKKTASLLQKQGVKYVEDLKFLSLDAIGSIEGMTKKGLDDLQKVLKSIGVDLMQHYANVHYAFYAGDKVKLCRDSVSSPLALDTDSTVFVITEVQRAKLLPMYTCKVDWFSTAISGNYTKPERDLIEACKLVLSPCELRPAE